MNRTSPPAAVYASPVATPGSAVRLRTSPLKRRGPSHSRSFFPSTRIFCALPFATPVAALRQTSASRRSRLPTPASRVYSRMIVRSSLPESVSCERFGPGAARGRVSRLRPGHAHARVPEGCRAGAARDGEGEHVTGPADSGSGDVEVLDDAVMHPLERESSGAANLTTAVVLKFSL